VDMALADPDGLGLIAPYMEPEPQVLEVQLDDVAAGNVDPSLGLAEDDVADIEIEPHERGIERIDIARAIEWAEQKTVPDILHRQHDAQPLRFGQDRAADHVAGARIDLAVGSIRPDHARNEKNRIRAHDPACL